MALFRRGVDLALQQAAAQCLMAICFITSRNGLPVISG
jgi:hypothetical protein